MTLEIDNEMIPPPKALGLMDTGILHEIIFPPGGGWIDRMKCVDPKKCEEPIDLLGETTANKL